MDRLQRLLSIIRSKDWDIYDLEAGSLEDLLKLDLCSVDLIDVPEIAKRYIVAPRIGTGQVLKDLIIDYQYKGKYAALHRPGSLPAFKLTHIEFYSETVRLFMENKDKPLDIAYDEALRYFQRHFGTERMTTKMFPSAKIFADVYAKTKGLIN